ncbi:hypothetical protein HGP16_14080 [Rhizobium sp. P40RR-XXII]|uniref:hypothetical protein n=1 Tax=Rhizobium sp. P40RR-XXII TaxID=2726739 RepID=UPI00145655C4|nr:hypothetical protein [Rhizobium sp. P40RR-XXII]NLS17686.1 hypothetical protein [Rhizobium sp. P40RR-XXII]
MGFEAGFSAERLVANVVRLRHDRHLGSRSQRHGQVDLLQCVPMQKSKQGIVHIGAIEDFGVIASNVDGPLHHTVYGRLVGKKRARPIAQARSAGSLGNCARSIRVVMCFQSARLPSPVTAYQIGRQQWVDFTPHQYESKSNVMAGLQ